MYCVTSAGIWASSAVFGARNKVRLLRPEREDPLEGESGSEMRVGRLRTRPKLVVAEPKCGVHSCEFGQTKSEPASPTLSLLINSPSSARQFQVKGPSSPVIVRVREAAVLPCHLSPPTDAQNMEIRWYRDHQSVLVHEYRDSQDHMEQQSLQYQGRTELLRENITEGQVALRIHPILPADEGQYSCVFVRSTQLSQAQFELLVTASGTPPHIHIQPAHTGSLTLTCSSSGWYPNPELQWRDPQGRPLSPGSVKVSVQDDGLIDVKSSVTVEESSRADVSCSIRNPVLREEKESRLSVAEALFPRVSAWTVALAVLLVLLAFSLVMAGFLLRRSRRAQEGFLERIAGEHERIAEEHEKITKKDEKIAKEQERLAKLREEIAKEHERIAREHKGLAIQRERITNEQRGKFPPPSRGKFKIQCIYHENIYLSVIVCRAETTFGKDYFCTSVSSFRKLNKCSQKFYKLFSHQAPQLKTQPFLAIMGCEPGAAEDSRSTHSTSESRDTGSSPQQQGKVCAKDIILDEDTAHPQLSVSEGGKRVECLSTEQTVPESPGRFTSLPAVLGRNSFSSGSHYWEVDTAGNESWTLGLCSDSVNRETAVGGVNPENGFWSVERDYDSYQILSVPRHNLNVVAPPSVCRMQELWGQRGFQQISVEGLAVQAGCPESVLHDADSKTQSAVEIHKARSWSFPALEELIKSTPEHCPYQAPSDLPCVPGTRHRTARTDLCPEPRTSLRGARPQGETEPSASARAQAAAELSGRLLPWGGSLGALLAAAPPEWQFQVEGPTSPVIARVREAAVFPCNLSPSEDTQNMEVRCYHDRRRSVLVYEYRNSQDHTEQPSPEYRGRTELLRENITHGQVALRIHPVLPGDEGQYSCVFVRSTQLGQAQFELLVTASGAPPHIQIQPAHNGSITLNCSSSGWYPEPELQWRDPQERPLSPDSVTNSVQEDGLIHVESSVTVQESSRADVSCSIRNPVLGEEKKSCFSVAEALLPGVSGWAVVLAMLVVFLAVSLMITGAVPVRFRRARGDLITTATTRHIAGQPAWHHH
ncbi:PREDICTED: uncharacterized protein LOC102027033 [Chinchilla lanigera]|uniref:uncharacterized protein LOC102027033 n=1 Tax=Chinchilla lanigera TaxID=34839 RepID=UPI000695BAE4|nr:PREDICTED: uncharacterized protein LOC102027033 [Chinchilla lanigera]